MPPHPVAFSSQARRLRLAEEEEERRQREEDEFIAAANEKGLRNREREMLYEGAGVGPTPLPSPNSYQDENDTFFPPPTQTHERSSSGPVPPPTVNFQQVSPFLPVATSHTAGVAGESGAARVLSRTSSSGSLSGSLHRPSAPSMPHRSVLTEGMVHALAVEGLKQSMSASSWTRSYSLTRDGSCFHTFLSAAQSARREESLVVVETEEGEVFGGFATDRWKRQKGEDGSR